MPRTINATDLIDFDLDYPNDPYDDDRLLDDIYRRQIELENEELDDGQLDAILESLGYLAP